MTERKSDTDTENAPWWSRPARIAIRVIAIAVVAAFVTLTVVRLLTF
ncbi:hypothetical protein ACIA58_31625 [Kribbella sp. NPDC051586]